MADRKPWHRQPGETKTAFEAFQKYLEHGSIDAAWRASNPQSKSNHANGTWTGWSAKYDWVERAAKYSEHLAEQDRQRTEQRRKEQRELEWDIAKKGLEIVRDALPHAEQFIRRRQHTTEDGTVVITLQFDVTGLAMASERFGKQGRLANDEPSEHIQLSGAALDALLAAEIAKLVDGGEAGDVGVDSPEAGDGDEPPGGVA